MTIITGRTYKMYVCRILQNVRLYCVGHTKCMIALSRAYKM